MEDDGAVLDVEADFLLSATSIFSSAFGIKQERVTNWRLMGIVVGLEQDGIVDADELRTAIRVLVPEENSTASLYPWLKKFVDQFGNDTGPFLKRVFKPKRAAKPKEPPARERSPNLSHFELTPHFEPCANVYVEALVRKLWNGTDLPDIERPVDARRAILKAIFKFQTERYYPEWQQLLAALSQAAKEHDLPPGDIPQIKLLHWVIMLLFWRSAQDGNPERDSNWILDRVHDVFLVTFPEELVDATALISTPKGCQILQQGKGPNKIPVYRFNMSYYIVIQNYLRQTMVLRPQWRSQILETIALSQQQLPVARGRAQQR